MLEAGFTSILECKTKADFRDEVVAFARRLGFDKVGAMVVIDHILGQPEFITVDNAPPGFLEGYSDTDGGGRDPVMQHCRRQSMPIIWDQATYCRNGQGPLWEEQARFGYRNGIAMALHLPEGRHFMFGVDRDQPLPEDPAEVTRMVADLQLFAVCAQDTALRILTPPLAVPGAPSLTPRELEALRWTMEGKTAWEVGNLLGISERTAALHVNNATHKLGCVNKHQAVLKALRLGLLR
jgi:DNA-binding CsgD family transcriptional regulator